MNKTVIENTNDDTRRGAAKAVIDDEREDKDEKDRNDANDNERRDIREDGFLGIEKKVSENELLDSRLKFYVSDCHAEGTGYEPPVLALRLDTPVIVYWDYIILDRLVNYIFQEVFTTTKQTPKLRVLIHQHLNISTLNKRFDVVKRRLSVLTAFANIRGL